ncbi:MAG: hypothetical protein HPY53_01710 [Brevinematales bacterium]|nr:hypothetical protein [Brevinematales bacterium]
MLILLHFKDGKNVYSSAGSIKHAKSQAKKSGAESVIAFIQNNQNKARTYNRDQF